MIGFVVWTWGNNFEKNVAEQNSQAVVLQQPEKSMFIVKVEQDTDWFAIGALLTSFFVTIWIVRRSTKQQIESNKDLVKNQNQLNEKLFEQQKFLRNLEQEWEVNKNIIEKFRCTTEAFIVDVELFLSTITMLHLSHAEFQFSEKVEVGSYEHELFLGINKKFDQLFESRSKLLFSALELDESTYDEMDEAIYKTIMLALSVKNRLIVGREGLLEDIQQCKKAIFKNKVMFKEILNRKAA